MAYLDENYCFEQDGQTYNLFKLPENFVIKGSVQLGSKGLSQLPDLSKVVVEGHFLCPYNNLTSLKGAPREVGGEFNCSNNHLTSLEGAPREVGGDFNCSHSNLTSLEGVPEEVGGSFDCSRNNLTSLEGAPREVGGVFNGLGNPLGSFKGAPVMCRGPRFLCDLEILKFDDYFDKYCKGEYFQADEKKEQALKANAQKVYETLKTRETIEAFFKSASEKLKDPDEEMALKYACGIAYYYADYVLLREVFSSSNSDRCSYEKETETKSDAEQNMALMLKLREGMMR